MKKLVTASKESFDALLVILEANGNVVVGQRWFTNKEGHHTYLQDPLDWDLIHREFDIDSSTVKVYPNSITTIHEWLEIAHWPKIER